MGQNQFKGHYLNITGNNDISYASPIRIFYRQMIETSLASYCSLLSYYDLCASSKYVELEGTIK